MHSYQIINMQLNPLPINTVIVATLTVVAIFFGTQYIDIAGKPYLSTTLKVMLIAAGVLTVTWAARRDGFRAGIWSDECKAIWTWREKDLEEKDLEEKDLKEKKLPRLNNRSPSSQRSGTIHHDVIDGMDGKPWTMDQDKGWDQEMNYKRSHANRKYVMS